MKILEVLLEKDASGTLYVGNEFSPDPIDMLQRIQILTQNISVKKPFQKELEIFCNKDIEQHDNVIADIKSLLTKNGYVEYNPPIVIVIPDFMKGTI
ncbi:hypothetical protein N0S44_000212 [Escherichia coli]|nr:hypothetical protein [Escherichia coli]EJR1979062.1 hypothetical protein [Escherichia coli]